MQIRYRKDNIFSYDFEIRFSNEFRKNKDYCQLNHFNKFKKDIILCKICKLLSTIYQIFFKVIQPLIKLTKKE